MGHHKLTLGNHFEVVPLLADMNEENLVNTNIRKEAMELKEVHEKASMV